MILHFDLCQRTKANRRIAAGALPALARAVDRSTELSVSCFPSETDIALSHLDPARVDVVSPACSDIVLDAWRIPRMIARRRPDVVVTYRERLQPIGGSQHILGLHEPFWYRTPEGLLTLKGQAFHITRLALSKRAAKKSTLLLASSQCTETACKSTPRYRHLPTSVAYLGGWPDRQPVLDRQLPRRPYILTIVSSDPRDDYDFAAAVFGAMAGTIDRVLVSSGRHVSSIATDEHILSPTDCELKALLTDAAVYLHVSRVEGFGMQIVEALQLGTPVVARAGTAVTEIMARVNEFPVATADAAITAVSKVLLAPVGTVNSQLARERFSWEEYASLILNEAHRLPRQYG